jgi:hypothetical protein
MKQAGIFLQRLHSYGEMHLSQDSESEENCTRNYRFSALLRKWRSSKAASNDRCWLFSFEHEKG